MLVTAYREFQGVTNDLINSTRKSVQLEVIQSMDLYSKKAMIRTIKDTFKFNKDELLFLADVFYTIQYYHTQSKSQDTINLADFKTLLSNICHWAVDSIDNDDTRQFPTTSKPGNYFMDLIFTRIFDLDGDGKINFADILKGLSQLIHSSGCLQLFFDLHDSDRDGKLSKEDTILFSETMLFLLRKLEGDFHLGSISSFLNRAFMIPMTSVKDVGSLQGTWKLNFSTFQELIIADDFLVEYLATFPSTFHLSDTRSGVYTTVKQPMFEVTDSIISKGFSWASSRAAGIVGASKKPVQTISEEKSHPEMSPSSSPEKLAVVEDLGLDEKELLEQVDDLLRNAGLEEME